MKAHDKRLLPVQADVCKAPANVERLEIIHQLKQTWRLSRLGALALNISRSRSNAAKQTDAVNFICRDNYEPASLRIAQACELLRVFPVERSEQHGRLAGEYRDVRTPDAEAE